jgi:hypothetical protein
LKGLDPRGDHAAGVLEVDRALSGSGSQPASSERGAGVDVVNVVAIAITPG